MTAVRPKVPKTRVLVLGVGNVLLSDEGLGVHVIEELEGRFECPPNVSLLDGGTGGLSLLAEIKDIDHLFIIDALLIGERPGTVVRFAYDSIPADYQRKDSAHGIDILDLLVAAGITGSLPNTLILGIQPADILTPSLELTPAVSASMEALIDLLLAELSAIGVRLKPKRR